MMSADFCWCSDLSAAAVLASAASEEFLLSILVQLIIIIVAARFGGWLLSRMGQPQVVGEIAAGLFLGPSFFGRFDADLFESVFPEDTGPVFSVIGQLGLIFLMFIVGLEFDFSQLKTLGRTAAGVALSGIALPFVLGAILAYSIHPHVASQYSQSGFVLFTAAALSITAIPILGRIMMEFGMTRTRVGTITISAAAVDDAVGWILLAGVSAAVRGSFSVKPVAIMLAETVAFVLLVFFVVRPLVCLFGRRVMKSTPGEFGLGPFSILVVVILASAVATNLMGVFSIFGPFVLGACLSDQKDLEHAVRGRMEMFVSAIFLPVFFTYTGLRTNIGSLDSAYLWLVCGLLFLAAASGKIVGCGLAARWGGLSWRESASVAVMMNTRALMGLIAVNIGRDLGVVPDTVFCMMVLMSILTTVMTAPILRRLIGTELA